MDLNYLYSRHQVSLLRAKIARNSCARLAHEGFSRVYAEKIRSLGAPLTPVDGELLAAGDAR